MEIIFGEETSIAITTLLLYTGFTQGVLFIKCMRRKDSFAFTKNGKAYVLAQKVFHHDESSYFYLCPTSSVG